MDILKLSIIGFLILCASGTATGQIIDSAFLDVNHHPQELNIRIMSLAGGTVITRIDQIAYSDTAVVDLYFTYCAGPASITYFDTILPISASSLPAQYHVFLRSFYDTNTVDQFCNINTVPIPVDSVFLAKSDIFLSMKESMAYAQNKISIYPNPVDQRLSVTNSMTTEFKSAAIISLSGKSIMKNLEIIETNQIDVSNLPKGSYFLQVELKSGIIETIPFFIE